MTAQQAAPWPDYEGKPIHVGDTLRHPHGELAVVQLDPDKGEDGKWRAVYPDGESLWLGNQIGDKGRAIVVASSSVPAALDSPLAPLPVAIADDEMAALRRFHECASDGEGYDVAKPMMKRLAEIGLVRRMTAAIYEHTDFGLAVLDEYVTPRLESNRESGKRLRLVASKLGLADAIPADDAELWGVSFAVLGMIRAKVEELEQDAARWQAFRARDEFEALTFDDFRDQFREDADEVIDAAMACEKR
jgi:hypothetical protein